MLPSLPAESATDVPAPNPIARPYSAFAALEHWERQAAHEVEFVDEWPVQSQIRRAHGVPAKFLDQPECTGLGIVWRSRLQTPR